MAQLDERARILEEWLLLPESRRRHPTDVIAFVYRLLHDRPDLFEANSHEHVVAWLLPHLAMEGA